MKNSKGQCEGKKSPNLLNFLHKRNKLHLLPQWYSFHDRYFPKPECCGRKLQSRFKNHACMIETCGLTTVHHSPQLIFSWYSLHAKCFTSSVWARMQARRVRWPQQMQVFPRIHWKNVQSRWVFKVRVWKTSIKIGTREKDCFNLHFWFLEKKVFRDHSYF